VAEAVAVAAEEVIGTVPEVTGKVSVVVVVVDDAHTIVTVLQARRTYHFHFAWETDIFISAPYQRLGKEDPPILGRR
jgi:SpoU rRNA methylase family enzyme